MHYGVICPPVPGHLNPMFALGAELQDRGHRITFLHMGDVEASVLRAGFEFCEIGRSDHPAGSLPQSLQRLSELRGGRALLFTVEAIRRTTVMFCREGPDAARRLNLDAMIVDQTEPAGSSIAEVLGLPFITVCNALVLNREPGVPPPFTPWHYSPGRVAALRNRAGHRVADWVTRPIRKVLNDYRESWGLRSYTIADDSFSRLAQISQQTELFDYPRRGLPRCFHYTGPLRTAREPDYGFPWDLLDGRPLVYASLGTLQNRNAALFEAFAEACSQLPVQLVISHGGGLAGSDVAALSRKALVVPYAPQQHLLARARATITHAGLNTVLDSLASGVPAVAVPITYEQPAIAERLVWTGAGCSLPLNRVTVSRLRVAVSHILHSDDVRRAALRVRGSILAAGGARRAADIIEMAVAGPRIPTQPAPPRESPHGQ